MNFIKTITANIFFTEDNFQSSFVDVYLMDQDSVYCEVKLPLFRNGDDLATDLCEALLENGITQQLHEYSFRMITNIEQLIVTHNNTYSYKTL